MPANTAHHFTHMSDGATCLSSLELQPLLQSLRATLADIDFEYENDIETVRTSSVDELFKQATIRKLQERHRKRRMPCVVRLQRLQMRMQTRAA
jgi:hypothetical protein